MSAQEPAVAELTGVCRRAGTKSVLEGLDRVPIALALFRVGLRATIRRGTIAGA